jgi:peptide-N4-(N-acetyl-beta-glucosaminyl)asparagine amidase
MEDSIEYSFQIYYEDTVTPLLFGSERTIKDFKEFVCLCLDCNQSEIVLFLESYGQLDVEDLFEFPLSLIELKPKNEYTYKLFCINKTKIEQLIKHNSYCTQKIFSLDKNLTNTPLSQYGLRLKNKEDKIVCYACAKQCHTNDLNLSKPEDFKEENFICQCSQIKGNKCKFDSCEITYIFGNEEKDEKIKNEIIEKCKNTLTENNTSHKKAIEKQKLEEIKQKTLLRDFHFEQSIRGDMQLISNYKDPETQKKIREIVPKRKENSTSKEYVKELLHWYKKEFFSWCNKPKCPLCDSDKNIKPLGTCRSNEFEKKYQSYNTELYSCLGCGGVEVRFPRYNSPFKLLQTKTGRCGEWANLFGCILYACGFKTRFVSNYEDHVWNEFYNEEEKRWIHVDSCEEAYDTPLVYEQGWGRDMTFVVAASDEEIVDVTPRYVKDWCIVKERRSDIMESTLKALIRNINSNLYMKLSEEEKEKLKERRNKEDEEFGNKTNECRVSEEEQLPRQSGSLEWRKNRGEI